MDWRIWIPVSGCVIHMLTLVVCYGMTLPQLRGTNEWMLSLATIGEDEPQRIIFTIGTTIAGVLYLITTLLRHHLLIRKFGFLERENLIMLKSASRLRLINIISTCFGCLGCLLLCLVGLRTYVEAKVLFIASPYIFFVACMWINTLLGYMMKRRRTFFYFLILSCCGLVTLLATIFFELAENRHVQAVSSMASYIVIVTFIRFISLYLHDFKNSNFMIMNKMATNIYGTPFMHNVSLNNTTLTEGP